MPRFSRVACLLSLSLWTFSLPAQVPAPLPETHRTEALADFDFLLDYLRRNYAGWPDKVAVSPEKQAAFDAEARRQRARIAADPSQAGAAMSELLDGFKDRHTGLETRSVESVASKQASASTDPVPAKAIDAVPIDVPAVRRALARKNPRSPWQGLWETLDGQYHLALQPEGPQRWRAVVLESTAAGWGAGQIKFRLRQNAGNSDVTYLLRNRSEKAMQAELLANGDLLRLSDGHGLAFDFKRSGTDIQPWIDRHAGSGEFFLRPLSDKTLWLRLPDFAPDNREKIESLLHDNAALLARTANLIIDIRQNGGGSDSSYARVIDLLCTRPIYSVMPQFRAGEDNARANERIVADVPGLGEDDKRDLLLLAKMLRESKTEWVSVSDRDFAVTKCPVRLANPANVGILINGAGSSGDQFVLAARESQKVTLFGTHTAGVIDYSNVRYVDLPSKRYRLNYATSRSMRLPDEPLDNVGIPADVPLPETMADPIGYMQRWLEARSNAAGAVR